MNQYHPCIDALDCRIVSFVLASIILAFSTYRTEAANEVGEKFSGCRIFKNSVAIDLVAKDEYRKGIYFISFDDKAILFHTRIPYFSKTYDDIIDLKKAEGGMMIVYKSEKMAINEDAVFIVDGVDDKCFLSAYEYYKNNRPK
jgi:hypothetical protein